MTTLAFLALMPVTLVPIDEFVLWGRRDSGGNLLSWAEDDNDARKICKFFVPAMPVPFARVRLSFDTGTTDVPKSLELRVKAGHHSPGPQDIYLRFLRRDYTPDNTTVNGEPFIDGKTYVGLPLFPLEDYVRDNGQILTHVEVWQRGPSTASFPCASFEYANLVVTY